MAIVLSAFYTTLFQSPLNGEGDQLNLNANGNVRMSPPSRAEDALSASLLFQTIFIAKLRWDFPFVAFSWRANEKST